MDDTYQKQTTEEQQEQDQVPAVVETETTVQPKQEDSSEDRLNALLTNKQDMQKVAENLLQLQIEEAKLKGQLKIIKNQIEISVEKLSDLARRDEMQTSLFNQVKLDEEKKEETGEMTPFELGHKAFTERKTFEQSGFIGTEEQKIEWENGWNHASDSSAKQMLETSRTMGQFLMALGRKPEDDDIAVLIEQSAVPKLMDESLEQGAPIPVEPLKVWETLFLVSSGDTGAAMILVQIHTLDEWRTHFSEGYGTDWMIGKRTTTAPNSRVHGNECGLIVKVGRKQYVIGSKIDSVTITGK
jgi:hypothetical protein